MTETRRTEINGRWSLDLPLFRAARPEWPWFEAARHAAIVEVVKALDPTPGPWRRRPVVYDVGSEIGDFGALVSLWGCDVVLAEPNPKAWPWIRTTWEANGLRRPLATWAGYVGDHSSGDPAAPELVGLVDPWPDAVLGEMDTAHGTYAIGEQHAATLTLDDLVGVVEIGPDIVSVDVEGAELHVLRGAVRTLTRDRPHLFLSIHPELAAARYGYGDIVKTIRWLMCEYGYAHSKHTHLATDHEEHWWFAP